MSPNSSMTHCRVADEPCLKPRLIPPAIPSDPNVPPPADKVSLKRSRSEEEAEIARDCSASLAPSTKRAKAQDLAESGPDSVPFWGIDAIKPLTENNLERLQDSMSASEQSSLPRRRSAPHRRVSELSSSKRSHSTSEEGSGSPNPNRTSVAASSPRFELYLKQCHFDHLKTEEPDPDDLTSWRTMMAKRRDSPEPDAELFHLTRKQVMSKNEVSVVKRLSPMLFPYRDLPTNNQKTSNLDYIDDELWCEWGSIKAGYLPTPKPDLCIAFKETAFTSSEVEKMKSPYILRDSYAPCLTLEIKTKEQMAIAERQNANNMIHLLQVDFALQKSINRHRQMEKRVRFVSTTHDTAMQKYQAWFYVIGDSGTPKWCCFPLSSVNFEDPSGGGFQIARRYNLNICEYISKTMFKELQQALATPSQNYDDEETAMGSTVAHLDTPSASSAWSSKNKRPKR